MSRTLPVTVIGGYLGAGKTTLVNHLLRQADGLRLGVLVNEFGDLPIDADLIQGRTGNIIDIAGGCVCCSFGSDLMGALVDLRELDPAPQHLLIEASGVAIPHAIAQSVELVAGYAVEGIVVLADAETIRARAADTYLSDTVLQQLADAHLVVANKIDLIAAGERDGLRDWLGEHAPGAGLIEAVEARVPIASLLGRAMSALAPVSDCAGHEHAHEHRIEHHAMAFSIPGAVDAQAMGRALADADLDLVRAKGFVTDVNGRARTIQVVGRRWRVTDAPEGITADGRLVCIRFRQAVARQAVERLVADCRCAESP